MNFQGNDAQSPRQLTFQKFYIKKVILNRKPQYRLNLSKEKAKIAFGSSIKRTNKDGYELPTLFYDKKYSCIDKHSGSPKIQSPRNRQTKSHYDADQKIKKPHDSQRQQHIKSLSVSLQHKQSTNQEELTHTDLLNTKYLNRFLPMNKRQLRESFLKLLNKHQANHVILEPL